jgi:hypothetical protein
MEDRPRPGLTEGRCPVALRTRAVVAARTRFPKIKAAMLGLPPLIAAPPGATASPFALPEFDDRTFGGEHPYVGNA